MKRIFRTVLALICALALCSCGAVPEPETEAIQPVQEPAEIRLSEVMPRNRSTLADESGAFPDWVELYNAGAERTLLSGWQLSTGDNRCRLPEQELEAGVFLSVFLPFSLKAGVTVELLDPDGQIADSVSCPETKADQSAGREESGEWVLCDWPTPGEENTKAAYDALQEKKEIPGPLCINEAVSANLSFVPQGRHSGCDWVEIKNISSEPIRLSEYSLSDSGRDRNKWRFPDQNLGPGELILVLCDSSDETGDFCCTGFSLSSEGDELFLSRGDELIDYMTLRNMPFGGSYGRIEGENGGFYFAEPSPGEENGRIGRRRVSDKPAAQTPDGVFEDTDSVEVRLSGEGEIHYTLDGSLPTERSPLYTEPLMLTETGVVRAVCVEDGALPSRALTVSCFINEGHSLPVLSLVTDDPQAWAELYDAAQKGKELAGCLSLYDGDRSFTADCGISMAGYKSLELSKRSMKIHFRGAYGCSMLQYDVFGSGLDEYGSLSIRAGHDSTRNLFRNELWQELSLAASDRVLAQQSRFAVLYINGAYWGIYCLKEDYSRQYYASHRGVCKDSVEMQTFPAKKDTAFYQEVIAAFENADLCEEETYRTFCERVDIDSYIDWMLLEGVSANPDLWRNMRAFRSPECGGKWQFAFFDLDYAFFDSANPFGAVFGQSEMGTQQMTAITWKLCKNPDFIDRLLTRYGQLYDGPLSNESILSEIDSFEALLAPEIARNAERWGRSEENWYRLNAEIRDLITRMDWREHCVESLLMHLPMASQEVRGAYFSD